MIKRLFSIVMLAGTVFTSNAQYQLANGGFEGDWENCYPWEKGAKVEKAYGTQPAGWCVSNVPNALAGKVASETEGVSGKAINLTNTSAMGRGIPAYMTLGTTWATAETKMTAVRNEDGGVFGGISFTYSPDAVKLTYKRVGEGNDVSRIVAYSWKGTWTQAEVPSNTAVGVLSWGTAAKVTMTDRDNNVLGKTCILGGAITHSADAQLVASAEHNITAAQSEWKTIEIPFDYKVDGVKPEKLNIVIATAGYQDPNGASATITDGLSLIVDNVELVYNSELASATYDGVPLTFNSSGKATVDGYYEPSKLVLKSNGRAAKITPTYSSTGVLRITVEGENISEDPTNKHTYSIVFKACRASLKISEAKWATYIAPFATSVPTGVSAYTVSSTTGHTLNLTNVGSIIPKHTPVILYSETVKNSSISGIYSTPESLTYGLLTGTYEEITAPTGSYVLKKQDGVVGFYRSISTTKVPANRCYLNAEAGDVKAFFFTEDETDGITEINADARDNAIYDLHGRRVAKAEKGIYIVNGKKVLVK